MRLSSTLFLVAAAGWVAADTIHLPMQRRRISTPEALLVSANRLRAKYGFAKPEPRFRIRGSSAGVSIQDQEGDVCYTGTVSVGTPPQSFPLILDTGSSDLWFADASCASCPAVTSFDPQSSSTLKVPTDSAGEEYSLTLSYGSGAAAGVLAQDTISMGGFTINPQTFLVVEEMQDASATSGVLHGDAAGLMGLAFTALAQTQATPFWLALANGGQLASPEFSFYITRHFGDAGSSGAEDGGVLTLGGTNTSLYTGNIEFHDVLNSSSPTFWMIDVQGVTVQGKSVNVGAQTSCAIDTGTTLLGAPTAAVNAIYGAITGSNALSGEYAGFWTFPCDTNVDVTLSFGGASWPISAADMNAGQYTTTQCLGAIFDITQGADVGSGDPSWIVGDTFLKNVYSVFRSSPVQVGFAQLAGGPAPSSISGSVPSATLTGTNVTLPSGTATGKGSHTSAGSNSPASSGSANSNDASTLAGGGVAVALGALVAFVGAW